MEVDNVAVPK